MGHFIRHQRKMSKKVTRIIVIEGDAQWVDMTLQYSVVQRDHQFCCPRGTITLIKEEEEEWE